MLPCIWRHGGCSRGQQMVWRSGENGVVESVEKSRKRGEIIEERFSFFYWEQPWKTGRFKWPGHFLIVGKIIRRQKKVFFGSEKWCDTWQIFILIAGRASNLLNCFFCGELYEARSFVRITAGLFGEIAWRAITRQDLSLEQHEAGLRLDKIQESSPSPCGRKDVSGLQTISDEWKEKDRWQRRLLEKNRSSEEDENVCSRNNGQGVSQSKFYGCYLVTRGRENPLSVASAWSDCVCERNGDLGRTSVRPLRVYQDEETGQNKPPSIPDRVFFFSGLALSWEAKAAEDERINSQSHVFKKKNKT